jgi:hypothetical protein
MALPPAHTLATTSPRAWWRPARGQVPLGQLMVHADRGSTMTSHAVVGLCELLGVARSYSRPHVSNDNPHSEPQLATMKYCPAFPEHFGCIKHAGALCAEPFANYNHEHRHSGPGCVPHVLSPCRAPTRALPPPARSYHSPLERTSLNPFD